MPAWDLLDMQRYLRLWPYLDSTSPYALTGAIFAKDRRTIRAATA